MITLQAREGQAVVASIAPVVMTFSRTEQPAGVTRTLTLLEDGTTELREGDSADALVVGHAALATVSAWRSLSSSPALDVFEKAIIPADDSPRAGCSYALEIAEERYEWVGKLENPRADRVWSMLRGLWSTVAGTPP